MLSSRYVIGLACVIPRLSRSVYDGDHDSDPEREPERVRVGRPPQAAHEEHAGADEEDPATCAAEVPCPSTTTETTRTSDRSDAPRDRVDEGELRLAVGGREQREVEELQHRGDDDERPDGPFRVEAEDGHGGEDDHRGEQRHRGRALGVARPCEQDVPERMQEGRREREGEGERRHRGSRVGFRRGWGTRGR